MTLNFNKKAKIKELKICYWNIHVKKSEIIKDKLLDPEFIKKLNNSDIVALSELIRKKYSRIHPTKTQNTQKKHTKDQR